MAFMGEVFISRRPCTRTTNTLASRIMRFIKSVRQYLSGCWIGAAPSSPWLGSCRYLSELRKHDASLRSLSRWVSYHNLPHVMQNGLSPICAG